jgi:hypothetical protein
MACAAGYIWLYFIISNDYTKNKSFEVCLIKYTTNIPCPSCGSTRSIISLAQGNFIGALSINPIGFVIAVIMLLSPIWIITDTLSKRNTLFNFYKKIEIYLTKPLHAILLIFLVILNWIWNITKGL